MGPDGALYIADWYDINLSHTNPKNRSQWYAPSRDDGRILARDRHGSEVVRQAADTGWAQLASREVAALLNHPNEWYRREAWRILGERRDGRWSRPQAKVRRRVGRDGRPRALWAIDLCGGFDDAFADRTLGNPAEYVPRLDGPPAGGRAARLEEDGRRALAGWRSRIRACRPQPVGRDSQAAARGGGALPIVSAELLEHDRRRRPTRTYRF